ncbi:MAG: sigma-70 family RNA polymerase sigma factor [Sedimentisphaerales bacterium]|nr:sigma-70 family RNA polymerase sigma factor [Sedimentisphaerales bacterium]
MSDVTRILNAIERGDEKATDELLPLVYEELRVLAAQKLSKEIPGQTLQATALVHEAYLRLVGDEPRSWDNRGHFFAAAAEAMRRILIDNARRKKSAKHGGHRHRLGLTGVEPAAEQACDDLLALDEALEKLAATDAAKAKLVKLRYFAGLTLEQAAQALGISRSSAYENWAYARAWLGAEVNKGDKIPPQPRQSS